MQFKKGIKCLNAYMLKSRVKADEKFDIIINIKNNNLYKIYDVKVKSIFDDNFYYILDSFCIDEIKFDDRLGINEMNIDTLYRQEEISLSYKLKALRGFYSSDIGIELTYKLYDEIFCEYIGLDIFEEVVNIEKKTKLSVEKVTKNKTAIIGEIISYRINIENRGTNEISNIDIIDRLSSKVDIVSGYINFNGTEIEAVELAKGIHINLLEPKGQAFIEYEVEVVECDENKEIFNDVRYSYEVKSNGCEEYISDVVHSDVIKIYNAELSIEKLANKDTININDEICFDVKIKNISDLNLYQINIYELLYENIEFVEGSFFKDYENIGFVSLTRGINIGNLCIGEETILSYKAIVKKIKGVGILVSDIRADFKYQCDLNSSIKIKYMDSKRFNIKAKNPNFRYILIKGEINLRSENIEIVEIIEKVIIDEYYVIKTAKCIGEDNTVLTGYRLNVVGLIERNIEYTITDKIEEGYIMVEKQMFCEYIILGEDYKIGSSINVNGTSKCLYNNNLNNKIYIKSLLFLEGFVNDF